MKILIRCRRRSDHHEGRGFRGAQGPSAIWVKEDLRSAVGPGAIRAFGEHKGSGLALLCELLGGSLTGNGATEPGRKFANGMFSLYVDPKQVDPSHVFDAGMGRYLDWFRQARTLPDEAIVTPGEPERIARAKRSARGVPLPSEAWASIVAAARSVGVKRDVPSDVTAAWSRSTRSSPIA